MASTFRSRLPTALIPLQVGQLELKTGWTSCPAPAPPCSQWQKKSCDPWVSV